MKSFENQAHGARVRSGPEGATNATPTLTDNPNDGGSGMADYSQYNDSARADNQDNSENWRSVGEIAASLAAKAVRK